MCISLVQSRDPVKIDVLVEGVLQGWRDVIGMVMSVTAIRVIIVRVTIVLIIAMAGHVAIITS